MNYEDFLLPPPKIKAEKWQIGAHISHEIPEGGLALVWVSDLRGNGSTSVETMNFYASRQAFYHLAHHGEGLKIADLGDLVSGKSVQDTHYILQEITAACLQKGSVPVFIGGTPSLSLPLISALAHFKKNISFNEIAPTFSLEQGSGLSDKDYLSAIFSAKAISLKNFRLLGIQNFLNDPGSVRLLKDVDFDIVRLSEMFGGAERTEHFFRRVDFAAVNCDAVESSGLAFSLHPNVNGLNSREICAFMKEIGLSERLSVAALFNFNFISAGRLGAQLLPQMIWHLAEGVFIKNSHPREKNIETFWVMADDRQYAFKRDAFSGLWYFGDDEDIERCEPCSREEYENAKRGTISPRLLR